MRLTNPLTGINGVAPDSTASASVTNDRRIHGFLVTYSNAASRAAARAATQAEIEADLKEFRFIANAKPLRRALVSELHKINALNAIPFRAGQVLIQFSEPFRRTPDGEEWGAFAAFGIPGVTLEIDIAATAVGPALSVDCEYDFVPSQRGFIMWEKRSIVSPTPGDDYDLNDLPRKGAYSRIHLFTDKISRVRAQLEDRDVHDRTPEKIAAFLGKYGMTVQAGTTPVVFDYTQQISDALDMKRLVDGKAVPVSSFNLKITHAAGVATYPVIAERLVQDIAAEIA